MYAHFSLRTQTKLSPILILATQLLEASERELEQLIWRELEDNPALELAIDSKRPSRNIVPQDRLPMASDSYRGRTEFLVEQVVAQPSTVEHLESQVRLIANGPDLDVAIYLLHSLDERGYLTATVEELAIELGTSIEAINRGVRSLHQLDPPGIGARGVRECFLIQCASLESDGIDCRTVHRILTQAWDDFIHRHWGRVARNLNLSTAQLEEAAKFMARNLHSHPLQLISDTQMCAERLWGADLIIRRKSRDQKYSYSLEIPAAQVWELRASDCFTDLTLSEKTGGSDLSNSDRTWIKSHLDRARLFINALGQRWSTLRRIGEYLLDCQAEFLDQGPRYLKPLTRSELSRALGLHESTVSRAVSGKTVQLPDGRIISLSDMFDSSIPAKEVIRQFLAQAGSPLSDRQIVVHLQSQGIKLARRTVTKYRQQLNLLPSYYREHVSIGNMIKG